jgi:hypothetical protein
MLPICHTGFRICWILGLNVALSFSATKRDDEITLRIAKQILQFAPRRKSESGAPSVISGSPNADRGVDLAIFAGIWTRIPPVGCS